MRIVLSSCAHQPSQIHTRCQYTHLFVVGIAQIIEYSGVDQSLWHSCLASSWVGLLCPDIFPRLFDDRSSVPRSGTAAAPPSLAYPLSFSVFCELRLAFGIAVGHIGRSARRRARSVTPVVVVVPSGGAAVEGVQTGLTTKNARAWRSCRSAWSFWPIWYHCAARGPRITTVVVVLFIDLPLAEVASWTISVILVVALFLVNRCSTRLSVGVIIGWSLLDDGRTAVISFAGEAVPVPSLRWSVTIGKVALGVSWVWPSIWPVS